jgi:hypothetical protein
MVLFGFAACGNDNPESKASIDPPKPEDLPSLVDDQGNSLGSFDTTTVAGQEEVAVLAGIALSSEVVSEKLESGIEKAVSTAIEELGESFDYLSFSVTLAEETEEYKIYGTLRNSVGGSLKDDVSDILGSLDIPGFYTERSVQAVKAEEAIPGSGGDIPGLEGIPELKQGDNITISASGDITIEFKEPIAVDANTTVQGSIKAKVTVSAGATIGKVSASLPESISINYTIDGSAAYGLSIIQGDKGGKFTFVADLKATKTEQLAFEDLIGIMMGGDPDAILSKLEPNLEGEGSLTVYDSADAEQFSKTYTAAELIEQLPLDLGAIF